MHDRLIFAKCFSQAKSPNISLYNKSSVLFNFNYIIHVDVKKAIVSLLFGGSRKRLPDGLTRRGDINLLLLGDPGTAKSQLLKFVEKVAPIGVSIYMILV